MSRWGINVEELNQQLIEREGMRDKWRREEGLHMSRVLEKDQLEALFVTARSKGVSVGFKILVISVA